MGRSSGEAVVLTEGLLRGGGQQEGRPHRGSVSTEAEVRRMGAQGPRDAGSLQKLDVVKIWSLPCSLQKEHVPLTHVSHLTSRTWRANLCCLKQLSLCRFVNNHGKLVPWVNQWCYSPELNTLGPGGPAKQGQQIGVQDFCWLLDGLLFLFQ